jgi:uncharacterized protein DUF397
MSTQQTEWRISSRCAADSPQCVEVSVGGVETRVRDTKGPNDRILNIPGGNWTQFVNRLG